MLKANAGVAQSVEQLIRNQQVAGSSPATSSKPSRKTYAIVRFFIFLRIFYTLKFFYAVFSSGFAFCVRINR